MSEATPGEDIEGSYGELLGEYFAVAAAIAPMMDEIDRLDLDRRGEYDRLQKRKQRLRSALENEAPDHDSTEIEAALDEAFNDSRS